MNAGPFKMDHSNISREKSLFLWRHLLWVSITGFPNVSSASCSACEYWSNIHAKHGGTKQSAKHTQPRQHSCMNSTLEIPQLPQSIRQTGLFSKKRLPHRDRWNTWDRHGPGAAFRRYKWSLLTGSISLPERLYLDCWDGQIAISHGMLYIARQEIN